MLNALQRLVTKLLCLLFMPGYSLSLRSIAHSTAEIEILLQIESKMPMTKMVAAKLSCYPVYLVRLTWRV